MKRMGFKECIDCDIYNGLAGTCMNECCIPLDALEKQIEKECIEERDNFFKRNRYLCPVCKSNMKDIYDNKRRGQVGRITKYCSECGQRLLAD